MTANFVLSPRTQADLEDIWNHTESQWGIGQAETYTSQLWQDIETIAAQPATGRPCPEVRAGYFKYRSGSHFLFYRLTGGGVDVVRILHERMDFERHFPLPTWGPDDGTRDPRSALLDIHASERNRN